LDLSKIEAGKMTVERIPTNPIQVVEETLSLMGVRAVEKGLRLACDWSWPIPQTITSDPVRLRQILINLIGNAIKFTQHGRVALDIRWDSESRCFITQISDTGEGMTAEQLSGLFKPFTQADPSTTRRFGGTGMGLAISRHFAEALGGSISVGSTPGVGTTFTLRIPTEEASAFYQSHPGALVLSKEPPKHIDNQPLRGQRILLAEDGIDNQRLISFHLRKAGAQVSLAENGLLARDMAINESRRGQPFDMILMDMQMPVMDGYTATTHLRALGYTGRIVALTAHAMNEDRKRCLDAGCDGFQTKPIDRAQLIQACLAPTDTGATSAAA
jgi:CheY-like chemotaxis protein